MKLISIRCVLQVLRFRNQINSKLSDEVFIPRRSNNIQLEGEFTINHQNEKTFKQEGGESAVSDASTYKETDRNVSTTFSINRLTSNRPLVSDSTSESNLSEYKKRPLSRSFNNPSFQSDSSQHEDMEIPQRRRSRSIDGALDRGIRFERRRKSFPVLDPQIQRNGIAFSQV